MKTNVRITIVLGILLLFPALVLFSQVSINTDNSSPDNSAMLDIKSTSKGLLIPRMTQSQIEAISSPVNGLVVFCTEDNQFFTYIVTSNQWKALAYGTGKILPGAFGCGDTIVDSRDGKNYNTVMIGTQCWLAQNLNFGTRINGTENQLDNNIIEKYCFNDIESNCNIYGGLYKWNEMMNYVTTSGTKGICPTSWHIPTDDEWTILTTFLGGESVAGGKLKSTGTIQAATGLWNAPNTGASNMSGFTSLPGGYHFNGGFFNLSYISYHFSSTSNSKYWFMQSSAESVSSESYGNISVSIRCMRD
jgi:uncharacterized protein (TIGR02145 family)